MSVRHITSNEADWYQYRDREIYVGDVLNSSNSEAMSVGFYRNKFKGERNEDKAHEYIRSNTTS